VLGPPPGRARLGIGKLVLLAPGQKILTGLLLGRGLERLEALAVIGLEDQAVDLLLLDLEADLLAPGGDRKSVV
jgi:hypothetical protein